MHEATLIISIIILILIVILLVVIISLAYNKNNSNSKNNFECAVSNILGGSKTKCPVGQNTACDTPQCNNYNCTTPLCNTVYYATDTMPYPCTNNNYFIVGNNVYFCRNNKILLIDGSCPPNLTKINGECVNCPIGPAANNNNCKDLCTNYEFSYNTSSGNCACKYGVADNGKNCLTMERTKCLYNTLEGMIISSNICSSISNSGKCVSNGECSVATWFHPVYYTASGIYTISEVR